MNATNQHRSRKYSLLWWGFVVLTFGSLSYMVSFNLLYSIADIAPLTTFVEHASYRDGTPVAAFWHQWPCCDSHQWLLHAAQIGSAPPPFRYRVAIPALVRLIPLPPVFAWHIWNSLMFTTLGTLMTAYLQRYYGATKLHALLGGFMLICIVPVTRTALVPGIDMATMVMLLLLLVALQEAHLVAYILLSILAVLTKEIFLLATPLWLAYTRYGWRWLAALVPPVVFITIRLFYGASPLEISFGYDLLDSVQATALSTRYARFAPEALGAFLGAVFASLGYLWLGFPLAARSTRRTMRTVLLVTGLVVVALFFLSSQIQRNLGLVAVVLIPPLIQALQEMTDG